MPSPWDMLAFCNEMTKSITKEELAWLVVRTGGLVFTWMAITNIAGFLFAVHLLTTAGLSRIRESLGDSISWEMAWPPAFRFVIYGMVAYYLLRRGDFVHRQLTRARRSRAHAASKGEARNEEAEQDMGLDAE